MNWKYLLGAALTVPLLPLLYVQGRRIKAAVPTLPEAEGPRGRAGKGSGAPLRLLTIGESTIAGVGVATHEEGFTGSLARELSERLGRPIEWRVYARSGYTAARVREKVLPTIEERQCDLIVIGLGGNNAFQLDSPAKWRHEAEALIQDLTLRFPGVPLYFTNMPPIKIFPAFTPLIRRTIGGLVDLLGQELAELVRGHDHVFYNGEIIELPVWRDRWKVDGSLSDFFSDGVHPAPITYRVWGRDMAEFIVAHSDQKKMLKMNHE